ncbi:MAG: DNRLRE domain-containing protein [Sedimentisphaerales bacterium]|nr:DNRLRE domain-containing protein [Sedimentisphaerales bacterium]
MKNNFSDLLKVSVFFSLISTCAWAVPAFPGAQGYGATATGGRGGAVYIVTNLYDSGDGSLRNALDHNTPRTIVFQVSGTIHLTSNLSVKYPNVTIAGQTAPGDGICIANGSLYAGYDNVIIRYIRCRLGDQWPDGTENGDDDATWGRYGNTMIFDHVTASWSIDETFSYYANNNFTAQWCLITESLRYSHHEKGPHGYGGIWGGTNSSWHHNLLAHHSSRNPRIEGDVVNNVDLRNNVIYNWGFNSCYGGENATVNIVNCYYKYGPATSSGVRDRICEPSYGDGYSYGQWYVNGNYVNGYPTVTADNWLGVDPAGGSGDIPLCRSLTPFPTATTYPVTTQTAQDAYNSVLDDVGCSLVRDSVDTRIIEEVQNGTTTYSGSISGTPGIIDSQADVGGWPALTEETRPAGWDTDEDGMPDAWETANGLDLYNPADRNDYDLNPDYTNLEVYLNSLVSEDTIAPAAPTGLAALAGDGTIGLDWDDNSEGDLAGYYVYRSTTSGSGYVTLSTLIADSNYTDDTAENGITCFYVVTAVDTSSNESGYSDEVFATPVDMSFYRDVNDDQIINMTDLTAFFNVWLESNCLVTTGWDINNDCRINLDEFALLAGFWLVDQTPPPPTDVYRYALVSCRTSLNDGAVSEADTNKTDSNKLSVRGDSKAAKSWIKFDVSDLDINSATAATLRITLYEAKTSTCLLSAVNDDCTDNISWGETNLTWNNAPGNYTSSDGVNPDAPITINQLQDELDPARTTLIDTVDYSYGGLQGDQFTFDVLSVLQADTDGIVQFVLHGAGGASNFTTHDSAEGEDYWPLLELTFTN